jgi:Tol biopolymer transport system component
MAWPRWSPDGRSIAFQRTPPFLPPATNIGSLFHVFDLATGTSRQLSDLQGAGSDVPVWSPDGGWIYFFGVLDTFEADRTSLDVLRADGTEEHRDASALSAAWASYGHVLAILSVGGRHDTSLVIRNPDGGRDMLFPRVRSFSWAPDGRYLAIERQPYIYVLDLRARSLRRLARGFSPQWSPVKGEVAYTVDCARGGGIHVVQVRTGRDRVLTSPCS